MTRVYVFVDCSALATWESIWRTAPLGSAGGVQVRGYPTMQTGASMVTFARTLMAVVELVIVPSTAVCVVVMV